MRVRVLMADGESVYEKACASDEEVADELALGMVRGLNAAHESGTKDSAVAHATWKDGTTSSFRITVEPL
jgi:hypothetical protein